jgi:hypothetical protein
VRFISISLLLTAFASFAITQPVEAAQRAFFLFQSTSAENVPGGIATNVTVTVTYSNASGTISNAVFTNSVSVVPAGQGVTASLASSSPPVANNGGTATLPLTISAAAAANANTTYQIIVNAANSAFTANNPPGIASITNTFSTGPPANSNAFSISLSPSAGSFRAGTATNFTVNAAFVDYSSSISGTITNGVTVSGPDTANVTAGLNAVYAPLTNNFGQTNLTLTINVNSNAAPGTYAITANGTNNAFTDNPIPGVASTTYTLTLTSLKEFTIGLAPASETVGGGFATNVNVTVTLTNLSGILAEPITNGVTVIGPDAADVAASLSSNVALPPTGGTASYVLSITNNGNGTPGTYQVIVGATNSDFTDNIPVPGIARVTNIFVVNAPPLAFKTFSVVDANLTLTGIGGVSGAQYLVCASANPALPLAQWTPIITNLFDTNGDFSATVAISNTVSFSAAQQFFVIVWSDTSTNAVAAPTFSPAAGPYYSEQAVTITSATSGATIRYTTDGSTPTETTGIPYSGPVTMPEAIDTNLTGLLTNCSGVTMLKAVAYKSGMADSAVSTGNYEILVPLIYPTNSSPVIGIAHMAYHVTSQNWTNTLDLWTNYFGFGAVVVSSNFALIKINDQQYVELYQGPLDPTQFQLGNFGFQVNNAELYREQLAAAGVNVPPSVTTNALGNLSFFTVDPDGHSNEWVQYLTNSVTGMSQGQFMPGTQLFGYINGLGDCTTSQTAADNYYINQCGFDTNQTHDIYIPNINAYIELLTAQPGGVTAALAGKHEKIQLLNFQGLVLSQSLAILTNRNPSIPITISLEGTPNTKQQYAGDVYDADGSRVRCVDQ